MENSRLDFQLKNDGNAGTICTFELKKKLKNWVGENSSFSEKRIRQIWSATWEAIQNALLHGSKPGDTICISISYGQQDGLIEVSVRQPTIWQDWELNLGKRKKEKLHKNQILIEGTTIMLQLADYIDVVDSGRLIVMKFSSKVKVMPERKIIFYTDEIRKPEMIPIVLTKV